MTPPILPISSPEGVAAAAAALRRGEIIAYPTDTLYGVGGDALSAEAARRTHEAKGRPAGKGFPVLLADAADVARLAAEWPEAAAALARAFWPGAVTIAVRARPEVPDETRAGETVALRVPGYEPLRAVIRAAGCPLIGTSANRSGEPPALTAQEAAQAVGAAVALILDGGRVAGQPSTVVTVEGDVVRLVRPGAVGRRDLEAALRAAGITAPLLSVERDATGG
jgi:L-threonylcarbamoyladenylate synthase